MESKAGNSSFLPRQRPDEIRLYLEAFKFALGEKVRAAVSVFVTLLSFHCLMSFSVGHCFGQIFLHCDLEAFAVQSLNMDRKACHYVQEQHRSFTDASVSV